MLFAVCMLSAFGAEAQSGSCGSTLTWSFTDNVLTISGTGDMNIGSTASYAIYKDQVKKIVVEEGVTSIDKAAFSNFTNLESVDFPSTLISIKQEAFRKCTALKNILLPESLQKIEQQAFDNCNLFKLTIPKNVVEFGANSFSNNPYLDEIVWNCNIPREKYQDIVHGYDEKCFFSNTSVRKVIFGAGVKEIPDQLFYETYLDEVEILGTIEYVGVDAFKGTDWMMARTTQPIYVGKCLYYWPNDFNAPTKIEVPEGTMGISPLVFADHNYITEVTLPSTLEYMGSCVFANCTSLTKINYNAANLTAVTGGYYRNDYHNLLGPALSELIVGPQVKSLPERLCENQTGLKSVILPNVENIGKSCFEDCSGLVDVQMDNVVYIDDYAFFATNIQSLSLPNSLEHIGFRTFGNIPNQEEIVFGTNLKSIGKDIFMSVTIEKLYMNSSIPEQEQGAGYLSAQVNNLIIGDDVTIMPPMILCDGSISGGYCVCKTLTVGRSVKQKDVWYRGFLADTLYWNAIAAENLSNNSSYVNNCRKVVVGEGVKSIPASIVSGTDVEEISLPEGLERIEGDQFLYFSKIRVLNLPISLKYISSKAFYSCRDLEQVNVYWDDPRLIETATDAFDGINQEAVLFVPKGTEKLYASTAPWSQFLNIGSDPDSWEKPQCVAPVISFEEGKLNFLSDTEDVTYYYDITDSDIKGGTTDYGRINLTAAYEISVFCSAPGHIPSETSYATLCFLSKAGGSDIGEISAELRGVAVCVSGHDIIVSGLDNNEEVTVYDTSGFILCSGNACEGKISFYNVESSSNIVIVKFNKDSIKVALR